MKVYIVGPSIHQKGGVASVIRQLMVFLDENDVRYKFFPTTLDSLGVVKGFLYLRSFLNIMIGCVFRKVDIVHIHTASRGSFYRKSLISIVCFIFRIPYIVHLHGAEFQTFYHRELGRTGKAVVRCVFARAFAVVALSDSWRLWLVENLLIDNVTVVFNGVPAIPFESRRRVDPTILFMGRLSERKGAHDLIAVMSNLRESCPNATLELAGDGDIDRYRALAQGNPNIKFLGWLDENGRIEALERATVFCLPSSNEGLPMSVLEAMSAGLPVVSTPVGGIPEAVQDGVTGILVEPGDLNGLAGALSELLNNSQAAESMGKAGLERHRECFSSTAMGQKCLDLYERCCL